MQIKASSVYEMLQLDPSSGAGPSTSQGVDPAVIELQRVQEADSITQMLQQALSWHANMRLATGAYITFLCVDLLGTFVGHVE